MSNVEDLAMYLREKKCQRLDAKYAKDPFFGTSLQWHELGDEDREAYRDVARDALDLIVGSRTGNPAMADMVKDHIDKLRTVADYLFNPFEPENQLRPYKVLSQVIGNMVVLENTLRTGKWS